MLLVYLLNAGSHPCLTLFSFFSLCLSLSLSSNHLLIDTMSKRGNALQTQLTDSDVSMDEFNGTIEDAKDTDRLGRAQQLKVYKFREYSGPVMAFAHY